MKIKILSCILSILFLILCLFNVKIMAEAGKYTPPIVQRNNPQIAIISTKFIYDKNANEFPTLIYTKGLLDRGIVPHKSLFHFVTARSPENLSNSVKKLYKQGVQYFIGPLIADDIEIILKALPKTDDYTIISTSYTADKLSSNNIIRFNVSDKNIEADYLTLYRQQFGNLKPIVIYGPTEWAKSKSKIFKSIALKTLEIDKVEELNSIIKTQIPNRTSPIIIIDAKVKDTLETLPAVSNPIIMGNLADFMDLTKIKKTNLKKLEIYTISTDVKNLDTYQVGKNIIGHPISPEISNLIYAMYYATDTIFSGQTKGSIHDRVLITHGINGSGLLNAQGEFDTFASMLVKYNTSTNHWDILSKIERYGQNFKFNCTAIAVN